MTDRNLAWRAKIRNQRPRSAAAASEVSGHQPELVVGRHWLARRGESGEERTAGK